MFKKTRLVQVNSAKPSARVAYCLFVLCALLFLERLLYWHDLGTVPLHNAPQDLESKNLDPLSRISRELNLPWRELLNSIKTAQPSGLLLEKFEPDALESKLLLSGLALSETALHAYLSNLRSDKLFSAVQLVRQVNTEGKIQFVITATWGTN